MTTQITQTRKNQVLRIQLDEFLHAPLLDSSRYAFQLQLIPSDSEATNLMLFQVEE